MEKEEGKIKNNGYISEEDVYKLLEKIELTNSEYMKYLLSFIKIEKFISLYSTCSILCMIFLVVNIFLMLKESENLGFYMSLFSFVGTITFAIVSEYWYRLKFKPLKKKYEKLLKLNDSM